MSKIYDVIILGGGPAGLTAGLYAGRSRLSTLIIEKGQDGGQIAITDEIENYPGQMVEGESGPSLISRMTEQAKKFGAERCADVIKSVELEGEVKKLTGLKGEYQAKCVIIATGAFPKPIGCENEGRFTGKGISFCATCDASFFEDFEVYVVDGDDLLSSMTVKNVKTGELTVVEADEEDGLFGLFGFIGYNPNSKLFEGMLEMENGYIRTDDNMHTNIPGVFAAGDIRVKSLRQVVTAAADGAIAAMQAEHYISSH